MKLEKLPLFNTKKEFFLFLLICTFILSYSLLIEYNNYKNLTKFNSNIVTATILKQYTKTKETKKGKIKTYQVLKLKSSKELNFYTTTSMKFPLSKGKTIELEIWASKISFYEFMTSFYAYSKILDVDQNISKKNQLNNYLDTIHSENISSIYKALYTATPLPKELQQYFSSLGVSHLFAISGFHLGVLSAVLFFLFARPYKFFQNRYFPYRSYKVDSFIVISIVLFSYLVFLDTPPSLLRAYVMLVIGFVLYDRGFKIVSMWTLFLTAILILSFTPRLFFSLGLWLSISGVFYIFLFLIHFKELNKIWQFVLIPIWVYMMMLIFSLYIFENFSLYHPISIILTTLFTLFYPVSMFVHIIGFGDILDPLLNYLLLLEIKNVTVTLSKEFFIAFILTSLLSVYKKLFVYLLSFLSLLTFVYAIYNVT